MLSSGVGGAGEASRKMKPNHKVSLGRIRDRATAKKPVVREKPRQNHSRRASKNIEATMSSQSSAQRRVGEK